MFSSVFAALLQFPVISVPITVLAILVTLAYFHEKKYYKWYKNLPIPPAGWPILGNSVEMIGPLENIFKALDKWYVDHGPRFAFRLGPDYWAVNISQAKDMEKILQSSDEITKSIDYHRNVRWLGTGLLIADGAKWHARRKMITPAFHFSILEQFVPIFNEASATLVSQLSKKYGDGTVFDVFPWSSRFSLDVICETAMGKKVDGLLGCNQDYIDTLATMTETAQYRATRGWLHPDFIWTKCPTGIKQLKAIDKLHAFTDNLIAKRKQSRLQSADQDTSDVCDIGKKKRLAFLDLLIDQQVKSNGQFTDADIREEVDTFMFEGHDTTTSGVSFALYCLGRNPEAQERVYEEIKSVVGEDNNAIITSSHTKDMTYLDCCLKEALRLIPSVPAVMRELQNDFELDDGIIVPAHTVLFLDFYLLHKDKNFFPNPEKFQPERFFPENAKGRNPFAYVPFSAGPRNCIGQKFLLMEEKIVVAYVVRNFKIEAVDPIENLKLFPSLITNAANGVKLKLTPR